MGLFFKIFYVHKWDKVSLFIYLGMGWAAVFLGEQILNNMPSIVITWLAIGGLSYTFGTIFYAWSGLRYHHAIWHLFVLIGSFCHYIAVLIAVLKFY